MLIFSRATKSHQVAVAPVVNHGAMKLNDRIAFVQLNVSRRERLRQRELKSWNRRIFEAIQGHVCVHLGAATSKTAITKYVG